MEIPDELLFETCYQQGSVFYFSEEELSTTEPHFFIVINLSPRSQQIFILAVSSSKVSKSFKRRSDVSSETLVLVSPDEYQGFTRESIIDCNRVFQKSVNEIREKHRKGRLKSKPPFPEKLLKRIVDGVKKSKLIENKIKELL
jgi:hypothetical protein